MRRPYGLTPSECAREADLEDRQNLQNPIEGIGVELSASRIDADDLVGKLNTRAGYHYPRIPLPNTLLFREALS